MTWPSACCACVQASTLVQLRRRLRKLDMAMVAISLSVHHQHKPSRAAPPRPSVRESEWPSATPTAGGSEGGVHSTRHVSPRPPLPRQGAVFVPKPPLSTVSYARRPTPGGAAFRHTPSSTRNRRTEFVSQEQRESRRAWAAEQSCKTFVSRLMPQYAAVAARAMKEVCVVGCLVVAGVLAVH